MNATQRTIGLLLAAVLVATPQGIQAQSFDDDTVLVEVNGEAITGADLDRAIMEGHRRGDMSTVDDGLLVRLLEKQIRDRLILQEARAMGLEDEAWIQEPVEDKTLDYAQRLFVRETYAPPMDVSEEEILEFFDAMYHKIQLRKLSLQTRDEIVAARDEILAGADFGDVAKARSLDTKRLNGGLHNFLHWADIEVELREASQDLAVGEFSEPFPYRDVWAIVRVEERAAPDRSELERYRGFIHGVVLTEKRAEAWKTWIASLRDETPVTVDGAVLTSIEADAAKLFDSSFQVDSDTPALVLDDVHFVTEGALRKGIAKVAMEMADEGFDAIRQKGIDQKIEELLLDTHALRAGYRDRPEVVEFRAKELDEHVLNNYLNETVVSKIRFRREELDAFYEEHKDEFRGPEEVKLSFLLIDERAVADDAAARLEEGTDFDYLRRELQGAGHGSDQSRWSPLSMFSDVIIRAVESMKPGEVSGVLPFQSRYMIVRLDGYREGSIAPVEDVEMQIRQAVFQRTFNELLDAQLELLEERSEIIRHEDRIREYFATES